MIDAVVVAVVVIEVVLIVVVVVVAAAVVVVKSHSHRFSLGLFDINNYLVPWYRTSTY